jgi:hypothetical protein
LTANSVAACAMRWLPRQPGMLAPVPVAMAGGDRPGDTRDSRGLRACLQLLLVILVAWGHSLVARAADDPSQRLRSQYRAMAERLEQSPWGRPLLVQSSVLPNRMQGDIHALVDHDFADVHRELGNPQNWCDVVMLHPHTKYCRTDTGPDGTRLQLRIGTSGPQKIADAALVPLAYKAAVRMPDYDLLELRAHEGPMGTSDYRISLEVLALPDHRTFLHLTYAYTFNGIARLAMQTYLATLARDKVGFTIIGQADAQPVYIAGLQGHVERNTMRYFLAITSFLDHARDPASTRTERRLQTWFDSAERYRRQLHELERDAYLKMKREEIDRLRRPADDAGAPATTR